MSDDRTERRALALKLLGKQVRFKSNPPDTKPSTVFAVTPGGMVEITGFSGAFAPHLFDVVGPVLQPRPHESKAAMKHAAQPEKKEST